MHLVAQLFVDSKYIQRKHCNDSKQMSAEWWCFLGCCIVIIPGVSAFSHSALLHVAHRRTSRLQLSSSPLLPFVLSPRPGRSVLRPQNRREVEMTMTNGQRLGEGGDDEKDKAARHTAAFKDNAQRVEVPSEVSQRELKFYLLSETLQHAIEAENYSKAAKIKRKIKSLRSHLMKKLEYKVQRQARLRISFSCPLLSIKSGALLKGAN